MFDAAKLQLFFHTTKFFRKKIAFYPIFLAFCKIGLYKMAHFRPFFFVISKKNSTFAAMFFYHVFHWLLIFDYKPSSQGLRGCFFYIHNITRARCIEF